MSVTSRLRIAFGVVCLASGCAKPLARVASRPTSEVSHQSPPPTPLGWGIPRFFEVGRQVRVGNDASLMDTTAWADIALRTLDRAPRAYLSSAADDRSQVFVYPEPDLEGLVRRYALVVPEPKTFSSNGVVTAFWGHSPSFMNFAFGAARSFASFSASTPSGAGRSIALRARLEPSGVNVQDVDNVYDFEGSTLSVFEHKGLVPNEPLSFLEYTIYDRSTTRDDAPPTPIDDASLTSVLDVALVPLRVERWTEREALDNSGFRVVLATDSGGDRYFVAAPVESRPSAGFGEVNTDLTLGPVTRAGGEMGPGAAVALTFEHASHGVLLSGLLRDERALPALLERGRHFLQQQQAERRGLSDGRTSDFAAAAARAFIAGHRSQRDPRCLTRFPHGDAPQPANSAVFADGLRYGEDLASALRGLVAVQRVTPDRELFDATIGLAECSLEAQTPSGATLARRFNQLALLTEHDASSARSDVLLDNGEAAVVVNHRRLLLASGGNHAPGITWGAFAATLDGRDIDVDRAPYVFGVDADSLPDVVPPDRPNLSVSRSFSPAAKSVRIHEIALVPRGIPAVSVRYRLDNESDRPVKVNEARLSLADFLEYDAGANERSQNRYGLSHVVDGAHLPVGFWMEGMKTPVWGDGSAERELDLTEQYHRLKPRFFLVYGFDRAQVYFLVQPADRLILHNAAGFTRLEARYETDVTLAPGQRYELPEVLSYTLRAPFQSTDGDAIPDQLQALARLWADSVSKPERTQGRAIPSFETDSGQAALVYSQILVAGLLDSNERRATSQDLRERLEQSALRGANFLLNTVSGLRNRNDWRPTFANGHDYGFNLAVFDWAYRKTADARYRDAFLALADDLVRPSQQGGLQISDVRNPSYGGYLSTAQSRAGGVTSVGDQGVRLWALRIAYERTGAVKYRKSAELFVNHWLRLDAESHTFSGTVLAGQRYRDAGIAEERTPLGHYAMLAGLKAWSDLLPRARASFDAGVAIASGRHIAQSVGNAGPRQLISAPDGIADFSDDAELDGYFLWAITLDPAALRGRFVFEVRSPTAASSRSSLR